MKCPFLFFLFLLINYTVHSQQDSSLNELDISKVASDIWFGVVLPDSLIVIAWIWDKLVNGKVHPVLGYVGAFMIAEDVFEIITFDNTTWRALGKLIYGFLSA